MEGQQQQNVDGNGVIGLFPILCDEGWVLNRESDPHQQYGEPGEKIMPGAFTYHSCAGRTSLRGKFGGHMTLFPGTRKKPTGPPFNVTLAPFTLCVPEFIY